MIIPFLMMAPAVLIILLLYKIYSVQAVRNSEALVISAKPGHAVTLNCMFANESGVDVKMWYKQRLEHAPLEVGTHLEGKSGMISNKFDRSRYKISRTASGVSLRIERVTKEDEGMYFCGAAGTKTLDFSNSTFLAVTGQLDISVLQTPVQGPVSPGESVTLQCTVLSEIRAADLRVLWFRAATGQSFPEIIYTHQNSSSRQCEISSSKNCSVYNFSRNILNHHHTGTYYCAVAACEKIIFGNGTAVVEEPDKAPVDPVAMTLAVFSAVCVAVICAQTIFIYKMRRSEHRAGGKVQEGAVNERTIRQEQNTENLHYAAIHIKEKTPKHGRVKKEQSEDIVYSDVLFMLRICLKHRLSQSSLGKMLLYTADLWKSLLRAIGFASPMEAMVFYLAAALGICVIVICVQAIRNSSDSVQAVRKALVISAEPGQEVTLHCTFVDDSDKEVRMWYKQRLEHAPLEVASVIKGKMPIYSNKSGKLRLTINSSVKGFSLSIKDVSKEDEGMYFCGAAGMNTLDFSTATFLAVTGQLDISVLQSPVQGSVSPGEPVTLQCTVLSEIRAADLRVLWFRAAAGQSFPEIIYTHQNSSSRQCEISSSTHSSVYNFSRNIFNHHHTGTYYCAVAACGKIIFGNGTAVELSQAPVDPVTMTLAVFSAVCVAVICAQTIFIYKMRRSEHSAGVREHDSVAEKRPRQDSVAVELNYAARSLRKKSGRSGDSVYSEVRYFTVTDPNNH
ncbi:hypothetical protein NFI96_002004 [Prochilodus magdalenae]|nr:hypothetical protein NFI96_002004 [Prochilodus magdalenae]